MNTPKVSLICPSYNHAKYIRYFIDSVLAQTEQNFELIIIDDCSVDGAKDIVKSYNDSRIKLIRHNFNMGINASFSDGVNRARADIICFVASDDILEPNYIQSVLDLFKKNPSAGVVYVSLTYIDENNNPMPMDALKLNCTLSRYDLLRMSFFGTNPVPSPGMAIKKAALMPHLPAPFGLLQYSDWDLHNKLLLNNDCVCTDEVLIKYRVSPRSASARSESVKKRENLETDMLMRAFLGIKETGIFRKIFRGCYEKFGTVTVRTIPYLMARMALADGTDALKAWGYRTLIEYMSVPGNLALVHKQYGLNYGDFISLVGLYNPDATEKRLRAELSAANNNKKLLAVKLRRTMFVFIAVLVVGLLALIGYKGV